MFGVDFPEVIIIFGLALIVLGPKKLPGAAAQIGRWVGRARAMARQFREQLEQEVHNVESSLDTRQQPPPARPTPPPEPDLPAPAFTPGQPLPDVSPDGASAVPGDPLAPTPSPLWTDPGLDDAPAGHAAPSDHAPAPAAGTARPDSQAATDAAQDRHEHAPGERSDSAAEAVPAQVRDAGAQR